MSEPLLRGNEIQGDSLAGFRKDHVTLFLVFDPERIEVVKKWLLGLVPRLATLNAVAQFNDAFRMMRRGLRALAPDALKPPDPELYALWINIAFTAPGLTKLVGAAAVASFETAFLLGAHVRAGDIGDPTGNEPRGNAGFDPVIGQNGTHARESHFVQGQRQAAIKVWERFIVSTGGVYLFAPSIPPSG